MIQPLQCESEPVCADTDDRTRHRVRFGGIDFDNVTMAEAVRRIEQLVSRREPSIVVTPNVDHVVRYQHDPYYADVVGRAALVLPDGQPIVWATRLLGTPLKERVTGSDLVPALAARAAVTGMKLFFLGGDPGAADASCRILTERYPGLRVVGTYYPRMGFEHSREENLLAVRAIRRTQPDVVLVGLGSPKQELWIDANMQAYQAPVSIGVGICFSFISGQVPRAPMCFRKVGLEWFWRLCSEPRRLWRRYLVDGVCFAPIIASEIWRRRRTRERKPLVFWPEPPPLMPRLQPKIVERFPATSGAVVNA